MSKQFQLSIQDPCHENWDAMTPTEKGRFCAQCQKQVVDFTHMSDRQLAEFFKKPSTGSICGRFMADQLDRSIEVPRKRIPWLRYFFQYTIPAFLLSLKSGTVKAQGMVYITDSTKRAVCTDADKKSATDTMITVRGIVRNEKGEPLPGASIVNEAGRRGAVTNEQGEYSIKILRGSSLRFTYVGYEALLIEDITTTVVDAKLNLWVDREQYFVGVIVSTVKKKKKHIPVIQDHSPVADSNRLRIWPNPLTAGQALKCSFDQKETGRYTIQVTRITGEAMMNQEQTLDKITKDITINLPVLPAGEYILLLVNREAGKKYSAKFIVQ